MFWSDFRSVGLLVGCSVCRSVCHNSRNGGKLHFNRRTCYYFLPPPPVPNSSLLISTCYPSHLLWSVRNLLIFYGLLWIRTHTALTMPPKYGIASTIPYLKQKDIKIDRLHSLSGINTAFKGFLSHGLDKAKAR